MESGGQPGRALLVQLKNADTGNSKVKHFFAQRFIFECYDSFSLELLISLVH